jgi:dTDP-4-amino-4,6-dideoxygalactose transaminase
MNANGEVAAQHVRFADLSVKDPELRGALLAAFERVLDHGMLLLGPEIEEFERRFAAACMMPLCVGVSSGSSAVYLALKAAGLGRGDEVITTPLSWISTLNALRMTGAAPRFVDIDDDLNIDADQIEAAITPRTRAILPVHFTGRICEMPTILEIAQRHGLMVIEDAAQAFGAQLGGIPAGGFGDLGAFSLNPMKVLPAYGEAGAITMRSAELKSKVESLRYAGTINRETCVDIELNHKIDALQAALLMVSLENYRGAVAKRHAVALRYWQRIGGLVGFPNVPNMYDGRSVYFNMTVTAPRRDELLQRLRNRGIEASIKHPILMPDQPAHSDLPPSAVPKARSLVKQIISLPIHHRMNLDQVDCVCDCVEAHCREEQVPALPRGPIIA